MKNQNRLASPRISRAQRSRALLEALEPRTLLTASILTQFDFTGYDSVVEANVDGQAGAEIVGIKGNMVTIINESKGTIQNFTFAAGSTITVTHQQTLTAPEDPSQPESVTNPLVPITSINETLLEQLQNAQPSNIYAISSDHNFFTLLNPTTGVFTTYNVGGSGGIGAFTNVDAVDLDGKPGDEFVFSSSTNSIITVVNPGKNTLTRFNITPYQPSQIRFASLDGQSGKDIYTVSGNVITIINPNTQLVRTVRLPSGVNMEAENLLIPGIEFSSVLNPNTAQHADQDLIIVNGANFSFNNQDASTPFSMSTGNTELFGPITLTGQSTPSLVAVNGDTVYIINDGSNTLRTFTFAAGSAVNLSYLPALSSDLFVSGSIGLLFGVNGSAITVLNPTTGTNKTYNVSPFVELLTDDFGGGFGSQIYTENANSITIINPDNGTFKKYSVGTINGFGVADLDGVAGDEIYVAGNGILTVITPRTQAFRTFNVGAFASIGVDNLDAQPGNELFLYTLDGNTITILSDRSGTFKKYNVTPIDFITTANLDGQPGDEILIESPGTATILNDRLQNFKSYSVAATTDVADGPVGALPGYQQFLINATGITVITAATDAFRVFSYAAPDELYLDNLGPPGFTDLITTLGTTFTVRNLANGTSASITLPITGPSFLFDDLDGQSGDEIIFFNGPILIVIKAS